MARPLDTTPDILEFDIGQKWAKGLRIRFYNATESLNFTESTDFQQSALLKQVHSKKIVTWNSGTSPAAYLQTEADGFIARGDSYKKSQKKLLVRTADCAPLFYVDRENECVAAVHAGWKGLAQGIHLVPFQNGFDPKSTWIWCGPCLNGENFEVGEDMWSQFSKEIQNNGEYFSNSGPSGKVAGTNRKFFFAWSFLEKEFKKAGVELFYNVERDTSTDTSYNSYRRWKKSGSQTTLQHNFSWISFV